MEPKPKTLPFNQIPRSSGTPPKTLSFNQIPARSAVSAAPVEPKQDGFLKTLIKDPIKTLVVRPVARVPEAAGRLGLFGKNIKRGYEEMNDSGRGQNVFGMDVEPVRGFKDGGLKQIAGEGLQSLSYLYGGKAAKVGAKTIGAAAKGGALPTAFQAAKQTAKVGAIGGAAYGAGEEMTQKESTLGSILGGGAVGGTIGAVTGGALGAATPALVKALSPAQRAARRKTESSEAVRRVLQGTTGDAPVGARAFREIDTEGVTTNSELKGRIDEQISNISTTLDEALETNPLRRPLSNLEQSITVNGQTVKKNYVSESIDQLEKEYQKTNNVQGLISMQQLRKRAETEGLNVKEINDLAKLHGKDLNAYLMSGKLSSGLTKQTAENTRNGLKSTSRTLFENKIAGETDKVLSDLIKVRSLIDKRVEAVNKLQASITNPTVLEKVGGLLEQALNIATIGTSRGIMTAAMRSMGKTSNKLDAVQLEKRLAKDLRIIQEASEKGASEATIIKKLQDFITEAGETPVLMLEAPKAQSKPLFGTKAGTITPSAQEAADLAAVESGKAKAPKMDDKTYRRKMTEIQNRLEEYLTPDEMEVIQMGSGRVPNRGPQLPDAVGLPNVYANPKTIDFALQTKLERYLSPDEMEIIQMGSGRVPKDRLFKGPTIQF